ncbi:hypothetical protein QAD02_009607 [Eretmocerus hayati]|uniref:Uncharacterized protein n=1 Tax=Eretmocerus hayati TaxID=131215 RepID=A0ACC2N9Q4_9HYME|nr:hypothetical protein QAD02_009607 [Eretmocerus hayati]
MDSHCWKTRVEEHICHLEILGDPLSKGWELGTRLCFTNKGFPRLKEWSRGVGPQPRTSRGSLLMESRSYFMWMSAETSTDSIICDRLNLEITCPPEPGDSLADVNFCEESY